jgi:hypothetical protein
VFLLWTSSSEARASDVAVRPSGGTSCVRARALTLVRDASSIRAPARRAAFTARATEACSRVFIIATLTASGAPVL